MSAIEKLTEYFGQLPGIGPRQAKRLVYFLLSRHNHFLEEFSALLLELKEGVTLCDSCFCFFATQGTKRSLCTICSNNNRETEILMLVEKDVDLENIERSGSYKGRYFVLGGSIPILEKNPEKQIRGTELVSSIEKACKNTPPLKEVIFALSNNPLGDNTALFLTELLTPLSEKYGFTLSAFGRGLSTGTELEYSDSETIKDALKGRQ